MSARYRATIPYGVEHPLGLGTVTRGELRIRCERGGRYLVGVVPAGDPVREPVGRRPIWGKVLDLDDRAHGLVVTVDLGARDARDLVEHLRKGIGPYALEPIASRGTLLGFEITCLESWPSAELRPAHAPIVPTIPRQPIPPRPDVNLRPLGVYPRGLRA